MEKFLAWIGAISAAVNVGILTADLIKEAANAAAAVSDAKGVIKRNSDESDY